MYPTNTVYGMLSNRYTLELVIPHGCILAHCIHYLRPVFSHVSFNWTYLDQCVAFLVAPFSTNIYCRSSLASLHFCVLHCSNALTEFQNELEAFDRSEIHSATTIGFDDRHEMF